MLRETEILSEPFQRTNHMIRALFALLILLGAAVGPSLAAPTAIIAGRVIDGVASRARENIVVLVEGNRIQEIVARDAVPDGATVDAEGFLWNCRWDGGCMIRFAPDGSIDRTVEFPCRRVTSATFGGPGLATMYITTVRYGLSDGELAEQPLAGGLFAYDPGVKGLAEGVFAG